MIERWMSSELTIKRWRRFKKNKFAVYASLLLIFITTISVTAEMWSHSKPIIFSHDSKMYFPLVKDYHPSEFGYNDILVMDYRRLESDLDWILWPLNQWDAFESNKNVNEYPSPPTKENIMGTDDRGRDIFARLLYGYRYSMGYALLVWLLSFIVGIILGGLMGYIGGKLDLVGQRTVEVFSALPQFYILLIMISIIQPNIWWLILISTVFGWIGISYYIRAEFLKLRKKEFVEAGRALGAPHRRLIFKHILPNALGPIITFSPFVIAGNIAALASLDYLGFGLVPPTPSWGELLAQAKQNFEIAWWLALYPSLALFLTLILFAIVGEGVRDAFDPRK